MSKGYFLVKAGTAPEAFELQSFKSPALSSGQVLIRVSAFGLNFADVMARRGKYREAPSFPFVPGYDIVGVVEHVFDENHKHLIGKRVAGFCRFGGYATTVISMAEALVEIGDMNTADALSLCTQGVTASYMADQISNALQELSGLEGAKFLEIIVGTGFRDNLGRPTQSPLENKLAFMKNL